MRIPDASAPDASAPAQSAAPAAAREAEHDAAPISAQDDAEVGPVAIAASNSLQAPEARIAELRQCYRDGTYQVDADKLSAKIVDHHLDQ